MLFTLLLQYLFLCALAIEQPSFMHTCKRDDPDLNRCIQNSVRDLEPYLAKGIPELGLPPLDPFPFKNVSVTMGGSSVEMEAELINGVVTGLSQLVYKNGTLDLVNGFINVTVVIPIINLKAQYRFKGKLLLFDIDGEGNAEFNATDILVNFYQHGKLYTKDEKQYINFDRVSLTLDMKEMAVKLENLFKNNELLTNSVNEAINDNIDILKKDLDPIIEATISEIYLDEFIKIFSLFSLEELFPK